MYRKPSSSFSLSYTSDTGVDTLTMLCPFTKRKKAWFALSCKRLLLEESRVSKERHASCHGPPPLKRTAELVVAASG